MSPPTPLFPSLLLALSTSTHATGSPAIGERESDCEALGCSISLSLFSLLLFVVVSAPTLLRSFLCVKVADCPESVHADTTKFLCHVLQRGVASVDFVLEFFFLSSLIRTDLCRVKAS